MRCTNSIAPALFGLLGALSSASCTTTQQVRIPDVIYTKDGSAVTGYATAYDSTAKVLTVHTADGGERSVQLADLSTASAYRVTRSATSKDDAQAQIQLGNSARDAGMYAQALQHYGYAEKADPSSKAAVEAARAALRLKAAESALQNARTAIKHDNLREAKKWLTKIVEKLPAEPQADEAAKLLDDLLMRDPLHLDLPLAYNAPSTLEADLAPSKAYYDQMLQMTAAGLTNRRGGTLSTEFWQNALLEGEKGLRDIEKLERKYTDAETSELLAGYRKLFIAEIVALHLHLASVWTTRSSYHKAMDEVNDALALDPRNHDTLAARAQIEQAAKSGLGWWY